jgi:F420H(2)-dependent quinone reductase
MSRRRHGFWLTNRFANHFVRPLLRGPLGSRAGRHLALLRVPGRRSGRIYELPVQYAREDGTVWVLPGMPERKTWWRNLRDGGHDVTLRLAGREYQGRATALEGATAPSDVAAGLAVYLDAMPRAARSLGLARDPDADRRSELGAIIPGVVMVRIDLEIPPR